MGRIVIFTMKQKTDRQNSRTNGKSKIIQTKSHKEAYTYTNKMRKKKKYIYKKKEESNQSNKYTSDNKL